MWVIAGIAFAIAYGRGEVLVIPAIEIAVFIVVFSIAKRVYRTWRFAHAVLSHQGIEYRCPWSFDVIHREGDSRSREKTLRENFAWLNRLTLSLLKQHSGRESLAMKRRSCGWSDDYLMQVMTGSRC